MLNSFEQVKEWIIDNGFKRWILYKDSLRKELIIDSAGFHVSDQSDKIAMTEKYLRLAGGRAYAAGSASGSINDLNVTTEIRLDDEQFGTSGIGMQPNIQPLNIGEIEDRIRRQLKAEIEIENLKKREAEIERREREYDAEKQSALGAIVHYFAPLGQRFLESKMMRNVAGLDAEEPVHARKVQPIIPSEETQEQEIQEEEIFTDAESEELFDLMKRFKAVEPENWLSMMRKMVDMAEKNDTTYQMARNFLIS